MRKIYFFIFITNYLFFAISDSHGQNDKQFYSPINSISRLSIDNIELTKIGEFGLMRKARPNVHEHLHTGIDVLRPTENYIDEPIYPITIGEVMSMRDDGSSQAHPETVQTLIRSGFKITSMSNNNENPKYIIDRGNAYPKNYMYSKIYNAMENPQNGYCAIMACLNPEECCPVVHGPGRQFTIPYLALEKYDTTDLQQVKYDERCREIAREMFFLINYITKD